MSGARPIVWNVGSADSGSAELRTFDVLGVQGFALSADTLEARVDALAHELPPAAIKAGMLGSAANVAALARVVDRMRERHPKLPLLVDPVLSSDEALLNAYRRELLPRATLATLNRSEAARLLGVAPLNSSSDVEQAARALREMGCPAVIVTDGDSGDDYVLTPHAQGLLTLERIAVPRHASAGSVFASSAAAALSLGFVAVEAAILAKMASSHALRCANPAGLGSQAGFGLAAANLPSLWIAGQERRQRSFAPMPQTRIGLYSIVDSAQWAERVMAAGARTVQLRIKASSPSELREQIVTAVRHARRHGAQLFVNDHWQLAIDCGADGVHLGQEDLITADLDAIAKAGLRFGISTHSYWEVCRAWSLKPSYIACGPIHPTAAKKMPWIPQGNENLAYWCSLLPTPVVAIGGMDPMRAKQAVECGAAGVAVIGAITAAASPERAVAALMDAVSVPFTHARQQGPALARPTLSA